MLLNYIEEGYLKGLIPELSKYLWSGETDYSKQKAAAEDIVENDFEAGGYSDVSLRPDLILRQSGTSISADEDSVSKHDDISRKRFVYRVESFSGSAKTLVLKGSLDNTNFETIQTISITATTALVSVRINPYKYYKLSLTVPDAAVDLKAYLTETSFDLLFAYKWLELILLDNIAEDHDLYEKRMLYFQKAYIEKLSTIKLWLDSDGDGVIESSDSFNIIHALK